MATRERTRQTDDELLGAYRREGDRVAREEVVERYLPFARRLAVRYVRSHEPLEDLIQVACLGLLHAIERFEPGRGTTFVRFAAPTIIGELKRYFRDKGWAIHVPREVQETALALSQHTELLSSRLGRSPTVDELAREVNAPVERVIEALDAAHNYRAASLDAPAAPGLQDVLGDTLGAEDKGFEVAEDRQAIAVSWARLDDAQREILRLRLVHDLSQREIGDRLGCSQMHVSRLLRRSLHRLDPAAGVGSVSIGSVHKTLSGLSQTSVLSVGSKRIDTERLKLCFELEESTNVSALLLSSIDGARRQFVREGSDLAGRAVSQRSTDSYALSATSSTNAGRRDRPVNRGPRGASACRAVRISLGRP